MNRSTSALRTGRLIAILGSLLATTYASAATRIGVLALTDDRQHPNLSLLDAAMAGANVALQAEGFEIASIPALTPSQLNNIDILWLPLLDAPSPGVTPAYTFSETVEVLAFLERGGRVIWFGDAGIYNEGDDSFLSTFGITKLSGNYNTAGPSVASVRHPILTGPEGTVAAVATAATFGLMNTSAASITVQDALTDDAGPGAFLSVSTIPNTTNPGSPAGRLALICDASIFEQFFTNDDHQSLLINVIRWLEAAPGYTPSAPAATPVVVTGFDDACDACNATTLTFADVTGSGFSVAASLGSGRCDIGSIPTSQLPTDFVGYAISVATSADLGANTTTSVTIQYDRTRLQTLGIDAVAESSLRLYEYDAVAESTTDVTSSLSTSGQTISGTLSAPGIVLFGAAVTASDCNENGVPDDCELDGNDCNDNMILDVCEIASGSTAGGGTYFCDQGCDADCNNNGIPDACDPLATITFAVNPANSGTVQPGGAPMHDICTTLNILATPADGYCFTGWTVDAGDTPTPADNPSATIHVVADQTITANFTPIIIDHPDTQTICEGDDTTFIVLVDVAYRPSATYQWRREGMPIDGATSNELAINNASPDDAGSYDVVISNACDAVVTSSVATLTVAEPPTILDTIDNLELCRNESVSLAVTTSGTAPFNYQWMLNDADIAGETGPTLDLADVHADDAGIYSVRVANNCGSDVADIASIVVNEPPAIITDPVSRSACPGDDVTLTIQVTGVEPFSIEWIKDGAVIAQTSAPSYTLDDVTADNAGTYRARVSNECGIATSAEAQITIDTLPQILTQPTNKVACPGDTTSFQVSAVGTNRVHRWRFRPLGGGAFVDVQPSVDISGQNTFRLTLTNISNTMAGDYQCIVTTICDPVGVVSDNVTLTVNGPPVVTEHPQSLTVCAGQTATFRTGPIDPNYAYQWVFNGQAIASNNPAYSGQMTTELHVLNAGQAQAGNYSCRFISSCPPVVFSNVATLSISTSVCDCNENGIDDIDDINGGLSTDCNGNGIPDECDIDENSVAPDGPYFCVAGCALDCDDNGIPDSCDIADGADDCNNDGIPDACQLAGHDCNADGIIDSCQLADDDCNHNGILDSCEAPFVADAGADFDLCAGRTSNALGGPVVASGSTPGYTYAWTIASGPSGGAQLLNPSSMRPQLIAAVAGVYSIHLVVTDATGCMTSDDVVATIYSMSVDVGPDITACATATNIPLFGDVDGGFDPLTYEWSVEPGSPDTDIAQFGGNGPNALDPTFTPNTPGLYTLKLTVTDDNNRACVVTDTLTLTAAVMRLEGTTDFSMCDGSTSAPLDVRVASGGTAPFNYTWSIESGSADQSLNQFGGGGIHARTPTFTPNMNGAYTIRAVVEDSSIPPCIESREFVVHVNALDVFAGVDRTICLDTGGLLLQPTVTGGTAPLHYVWTIEAGSPSQNHLQFENQSGLHPNWGFRPQAVGAYTLKLTVTDSATPPCSASDTRIIRTSRLNLDAGPDLVTKAFEPSAALGAIPVVVGATGPVDFTWRIIAGPSLDSNQLSDAKESRPSFTPSAVGRYALELVAEAEEGCTQSDQILIDAIIDKHAMTVNSEGRAFYELRLDAPHTRADVRFHNAEKGLQTSAEIMNAAEGAPFPRQVATTIEPSDQSFALVVALYANADEMAAMIEGSVLVRWTPSAGEWRAVADRDMESGFYPARPTKDDIGRQGIDKERGIVWAIADVDGIYTIGLPGLTTEPVTGASTPIAQPTPTQDTGMCGTGGMGMMTTLALMFVGSRRRRRA
ncbi:MAG: hypothetical protein H6819_02830 [Phycisphaerales bacterium]|nr:hypothetical protein [Phycisphaerales bacterium]